MRHLLKFLHSMGAIGLMGAMACLLVMLAFLPEPTQLASYAAMRGAMAGMSKWVFMPSFLLTLVAGLLAMATTRGFHDAGWVLAKLALGLIVFEWCLVGIDGPMKNEAELSASVLAAAGDPASLGLSLGAERNSLWIMLAVATANVVLGVWRPRFTRKR